MIPRLRILVCASLAAVFLLGACRASVGSDEVMDDYAYRLQTVAYAVHIYVTNANPRSDLSASELLAAATRKNPSLLEPFNEYFITVHRDGMLTSVLVCNREQTQALVEDAGCTSAKTDARLWKNSPRPPCASQVDLAATCARR